MKNVLVLCTGNSCRSQMAHGYLNKMASNVATVYSAGIETHGINPGAAATMAKDGIDITGHTSNNLSLIHISEPTRQAEISYAVFCLKKKK